MSGGQEFPQPGMDVANAAAMQELYRQVKTIYRNVKEAGARGAPSTPTPRGEPKPMRERSPVPVPDRRPWGYATPVRRPSPTTPRTTARSASAPLERHEAAPKPPLGGHDTHRPRTETEPRLLVTRYERRTPDRVPAKQPPVAQPPELSELRTRIETLEGALQTEKAFRESLQSELESMRRSLETNMEMQARYADEHKVAYMSLSSQVQFAMAWIQQVDSHIAEADDEPEAIPSRPPSSSVSRRLDMNTSDTSGTHRLPPGPPLTLVNTP
jgi:hypothetical protein